MRHIISVLLENETGALARVTGLFAQRGYNIESLTVSVTEDDTLSRTTIITTCGDAQVEQIIKQLSKLIEVIKVVSLTEGDHVERELLLIKIHSEGAGSERAEIKRLADIFQAQIVDVTHTTYTVELVGSFAKVSRFISTLGLLKDIKILEVVRSGVLGIARGDKPFYP